MPNGRVDSTEPAMEMPHDTCHVASNGMHRGLAVEYYTGGLSWASHGKRCENGHVLTVSYSMERIISRVGQWENCPSWHHGELHGIPQGVYHGAYSMGRMHSVVCTTTGCIIVQHGPYHGLPHGLYHDVPNCCAFSLCDTSESYLFE